MLLFIIGVIGLIVGIVFAILYRCINLDANICFSCSYIILSIFSFWVVVAGICGIGNYCTKDNEYQKMLYEKEVIEYRLENQSEILVGNELLYKDIVEFNNELRIQKKYANNIWTNWYFNDKIASIEFIEYKVN